MPPPNSPPLPAGFVIEERAPALPPGFQLERQARRSDLPSAIVQSINQGATLGWADEIGAGITAAARAPFTSKTLRGEYDDALAEERSNLAAAREQYPKLFFGGEAVGAALPTSRMAQVANKLNVPAWMKVAGVGGAAGATYGAGAAEGGDPTLSDLVTGETPESRLGAAATGGVVGAVASPVLSWLAKPVMTGARNALAFARDKITATPRREAERQVAKALQSDLADPAAAARLQRVGQGGELALVDVGENTAGLARAAAAKPGPFRTAATQNLRTRQAGQQRRLVDAFGIRGGNEAFKDSFDEWLGSRITAAKPAYDAAYAASIDVTTDAFKNLLGRPAMQVALRQGRVKLANVGGGKGNGPVQILDAAKRALDDEIGVAQRAGKADDVRILAGIKRELVTEMDRQVPAYAKARELFAGEAAIRDAANFGTELFKRATSHDDARRVVADMTASELDVFRRGALRGLIEVLETTPENRNAAQKLIESVSVRDKLRLLFADEQSFAQFVQQAGDEAQMSYSRNFVLGGSPTARIQEEARALTGAGEIIRDAATGNHIGLFSRFLRSLGYGDVSPEVLDELGKHLLQPASPQTVQRLTTAATRVPLGPISPTTQLTTGGLIGAVAGNAMNPPPRQGAGETPEQRRRRLLVEELQRGAAATVQAGAQ